MCDRVIRSKVMQGRRRVGMMKVGERGNDKGDEVSLGWNVGRLVVMTE